VTELYGGSAHGRSIDVSVSGATISFGSGFAGGDFAPFLGEAHAGAAGIGTPLLTDTMVAASSAGEQADGCADVDGALAGAFGDLHLGGGLACGRASVVGSGSDVVAHGSGSLASLSVDADGLVAGLLDIEALAPVLDLAFGALPAGTLDDARDDARDDATETVEDADEALHDAVGLLNDRLTELTGGLVTVPDLDLTDTLGDLVERLERTRLVEVSAGAATGEVAGSAARLVSRAGADVTTISLLPGFWPDGDALATVRIGGSSAQVSYERAGAVTTATADNPVVHVESRLLPGQPAPISAGETMRLFCDDTAGALTEGLLCTEIAVGTAEEREHVDGRHEISTAAVTVHIAKGLDVPTPVVDLPELPVDLFGTLGTLGADLPGDVLRTVNDVVGTLGVDEGVATAAGGPRDGGVRVSVAGATAQAGGASVMPDQTDRQEVTADPVADPGAYPGAYPGSGELPRTGGLDALPQIATGLLGAAAGLRTLVRRRAAVVGD
jgi:hypothetical protein